MTDGSNSAGSASARILVVDDDPLVREIAHAKLTADGHAVCEAENGAEGWTCLHSQPFDLALIDLEMPHVDGFTLIERVRADAGLCHLPVIVITSLQDEAAVDRAFDAGANSFVSKPLVWPSLQRQVRYVWRAHVNERELRDAKEQAERSVRLKNSFMSVINHELRTPLTHIIGFAEVLQRETDGPLGSPAYVDYVNEIVGAGRRLLGNITEVILLSRALAGEIELEEGEYEIASLLNDVLIEVNPTVRSHNAEISVLQTGEDFRVRCDLNLLGRCLIALLDNAVKFSPDGGTVEVNLMRGTDGGFEVHVCDHGPGMTPAQIADCYEPFVQSDMSFRRSAEGIGLGLTLVRTLSELHGGELVLDSTLGVGTEAVVRLPASRVLDITQRSAEPVQEFA